MPRCFSLLFLLVVAGGCRRELEIRTDPDLWHVDAREARRLHHARTSVTYVSRVSDRATWQIHTSLADPAALTDGDPATVASSTDEHRRGEFILIDLGESCRFQMIRQVHPPSGGAPPRFRIDTAGPHGFPYTLQYLGAGEPHETAAALGRPVDARFIRITIVEETSDPWLVNGLSIE
jgi:hypothetical protein